MLCGSYLLSLFVFGAIYFLLSRREPSEFVYNGDVLDAQRASIHEAVQKRLDAVRHDYALLVSVIDSASAEKPETRLTVTKRDFANHPVVTTFVTGDYCLEFAFYSTLPRPTENGPVVDEDRHDIVLSSRRGERLALFIAPQSASLPENITAALDLLKNAGSDRRTERAGLESRLASLRRQPSQSFGPLDFLYFSVITQTTVGYGDILPNSTTVRMLVSLQVLLGLALIGVALNIVLSSKQ